MNNEDKIFRDFIEKNYPDEEEIIKQFNYDIKEISNINNLSSSKIDDSLGFGENFSIISGLAAFIFLVASQKVVELGIELSRDKLLKIILENREKIIKISKERYDTDVEAILSKIISFLQSRQN